MGISRTAYVKWETGESKPIRKLQELSALFNVSVDYLLGNEVGHIKKENVPKMLTNDTNRLLSQEKQIFDGSTVNMKIGDRIKDLREKQGITQAELAERIMVDKSVMNRIELGTRLIRNDELLLLSHALNVSTDFLLGNMREENIQSNEQPMKIDLNDLLEQPTILFAGDVYHLTKKDRFMIKRILETILFFGIKNNKTE